MSSSATRSTVRDHSQPPARSSNPVSAFASGIVAVLAGLACVVLAIVFLLGMGLSDAVSQEDKDSNTVFLLLITLVVAPAVTAYTARLQKRGKQFQIIAASVTFCITVSLEAYLFFWPLPA